MMLQMAMIITTWQNVIWYPHPVTALPGSFPCQTLMKMPWHRKIQNYLFVYRKHNYMKAEKKKEIEILEILVQQGIQSSGQGYMLRDFTTKYPVEFVCLFKKYKKDSANINFGFKYNNAKQITITLFKELQEYLVHPPVTKQEKEEYNVLIEKLEMLILMQQEQN
jgi:hypothetical protein